MHYARFLAVDTACIVDVVGIMLLMLVVDNDVMLVFLSQLLCC